MGLECITLCKQHQESPLVYTSGMWVSAKEFYSQVSGGPKRYPSGKEPACQCKRHQRHRFDTWVRKIPWRRAWQPTPVFLPREFCGQRSLTRFRPRGCKESDIIEQLTHPWWKQDEPRRINCIYRIQLSVKNTECPAIWLKIYGQKRGRPINWHKELFRIKGNTTGLAAWYHEMCVCFSK